uniref:Transcription factor PIF4 n=1 Tax=Rhizophora mucronata TaxID=61149 RepID=A0A2P2KAD1_RHIMU
MNHCLSDWNFDGDAPAFNLKKATGQDNELVELLWRDGQVVLHSQTHRKTSPYETRQGDKYDLSGASGENISSLVQDNETVSWIQYSLEDSFDKELCSDFFHEFPSSDPTGAGKFAGFDANHVVATSEQHQSTKINTKHPSISEVSRNPPRLPTRSQIPEQTHNLGGFGKSIGANFSKCSVPLKGDLRSSSRRSGGKGSEILMQARAKECSVMTVGSTNQISSDPDISRASSNGTGSAGLSGGPLRGDLWRVISQSERGKTDIVEPTVTVSSGGSGSSLGRSKQSTETSGQKRKCIGAEELECQSEAAELESAAANKPAKRPGSVHRTRSAEVHNLSERKRRDRINEKMKALQELIPHCNKTDKASMLDEAIEYLKSLQWQLQVMWMGSGMGTMMFPGIHHYMSPMGMRMVPPCLPSSVHSALHLSRVPLVDQSVTLSPAQNPAIICQTPVLHPANYQNQMQNPALADHYAHFMGFHTQNASQAANMFRFVSPTLQQTQAVPQPGGTRGQTGNPAATTDHPPSSKK